MSSNVYNIFYFFISLFHKFIYQWGSIKHELILRNTNFTSRNLFLWDEKQETLWAAKSLRNFYLVALSIISNKLPEIEDFFRGILFIPLLDIIILYFIDLDYLVEFKIQYSTYMWL